MKKDTKVGSQFYDGSDAKRGEEGTLNETEQKKQYTIKYKEMFYEVNNGKTELRNIGPFFTQDNLFRICFVYTCNPID
mgnify:CR=1 FL=1